MHWFPFTRDSKNSIFLVISPSGNPCLLNIDFIVLLTLPNRRCHKFVLSSRSSKDYDTVIILVTELPSRKKFHVVVYLSLTQEHPLRLLLNHLHHSIWVHVYQKFQEKLNYSRKSGTYQQFIVLTILSCILICTMSLTLRRHISTLHDITLPFYLLKKTNKSHENVIWWDAHVSKT